MIDKYIIPLVITRYDKQTDLLSTYTETGECDFKERHYSVRDNGAIYRHSKPGKPASKLDNS